MADENLIGLRWRREYLPVRAALKNGNGHPFYDFDTVWVPPYHPSMEEKLDFDLAVSVLPEVLENTVSDLEGVADEIPEARKALEGIERNGEAKIKYTDGERNSHSVEFLQPFFPIVKRLRINERGIYLFGNRSFCIDYSPVSTIAVPKSVVLPEELRREYEMREASVNSEYRYFRCPYCWDMHNETDVDRVFVKNLVMVLNNAVVRRKYGEE